ncbi:MAG TPA: hypothetical protein VHK44_03475 [Xanthobacteraceae bacterium]|nr:hypothetical protein [Xanthobacteraceae bacterium]
MTDTHRALSRERLDPEIQALLHPSAAFEHPRDVLKDPDLTTYEKRAILSAWASDACAVESAPALRRPPGFKAAVCFDDIIDALRSLDDDPPPPRPGGKSMRVRAGPSGPEPDQGGARTA